MRHVKQLISRVLTVAVWAMAVLAPAVALAQRPATPDQPSLRNIPKPWLGYLIIVVLLAIVLVISLMPSKRSHQN